MEGRQSLDAFLALLLFKVKMGFGGWGFAGGGTEEYKKNLKKLTLIPRGKVIFHFNQLKTLSSD